MNIALLGDATWAFDRRTGLEMTGYNANPSHQLSGIVELSDIPNLSQQNTSGFVGNTGNGGEKLVLFSLPNFIYPYDTRGVVTGRQFLPFT